MDLCLLPKFHIKGFLSLSLSQAEDEFRDKLSPIYISLNFSLDPHASVDQHGLRPILRFNTEQQIQQKVQYVCQPLIDDG